ncbi:MAG: DNA-processing protein DprA [Prevotella sp.]|nr:DNA-processing protein DprA [Prevotella sp.]
MSSEEIFYTIAFTRLTGFNSQTAQLLYRELGSAKAIYDHRSDIADIIPDCSPRVVESLRNWDDAMKRATAEMTFIGQHKIQALTLNDPAYPRRLADCPDAPIIIYYRGTTDLNQQRVINMVGTRRCTTYGQDLVRRFITQLKVLCPQVLIVSGLAYGIDICAHRQALASGYDTVGVLAHGLDTIYPAPHRQTATEMVCHGGLLTEYVTQTEPMANNFRQRNRIVAGVSDATIVVESAAKGGALITARIAQDYGRDVFAFPGPVGAPYSEGCNNLIRDNRAALISSADDFVAAMGWQVDAQREKAKAVGIERHLFPNLSPDEQAIVNLLSTNNDLQLNVISVHLNKPIGAITALLFNLEMKGVVKPLAGGTYHLLMA